MTETKDRQRMQRVTRTSGQTFFAHLPGLSSASAARELKSATR